ncbi:HNH endonuclease signature motif containing protein [Labedella populi]|nr:HNH endonuclease signature motif containing protein [Labedella populi]
MGEHETQLRVAIAHAVDELAAPLDAFVPARLSGDDYLVLVREIESLGRVVDALRLRVAADAAGRSGGPIDTFGELGHKTAEDGLAKMTGVSVVTAKARIRVGAALTPTISLSGSVIAPAHRHIAAAVAAGSLGVEAAGLLIRELDSVAGRVSADVLDEAERGLVLLAAGEDTHPPLRVDLVRGQAALFIARIDPDGARPKEERARKRRKLHFGRETPDGLIPLTGYLMGEVGAGLKRLIDAHLRSPSFTDPDADPTADPTADPDAAFRDPSDIRDIDQKRHDIFASIINAAARMAGAPELGGAAPAVIVTVTAADLDDPNGVGFIDGLNTPVPVATIERLIDTGGFQLETFGANGRILSLSSVQRCFNATQRRAITGRDGGCIIPDCSIPAGWCEVHHVIPYRDGGVTHTDNGVLLCWGHHQNIDTGPWRITMPNSIPHVRGPGHHEWTHVTKARTRPPLPATG